MKARFNTSLLWLALAMLVTSAVGADEKEKIPVAQPVIPQAANYVLREGDVVAIRVFREPTLDSQCRISKDGTINFPLLGLIKVTGRTANDASAYIATLLDKDYIVKPQVSVSVVAYSRQPFNILGQVGKPGGYTMPEEDSLDLLSAIAMAGGFTRLADQGHVAVRRHVEGKDQTITVDAKKLAKGSKAEHFMVLPYDTITVPERFF